MASSRAKLFIENFFIYGVGNVLTKAVPFIMLPVLTRLITDPAVFGVYDIYNIIIQFATPLAVLGSYDAMFRLFFDDSNPHFQKQICSSSLTIVTTTSLVALFATLILWVSGISFFEGYSWLIPVAGLIISSHAIQSIVAAPTRMQNQKKRIILISLLAPLIYYLFAMVLAWKGWPLEGLVYGNLISGLSVLAIYSLLNHDFFSYKCVDIGKAKDLVILGIPLVPSLLVMWVFASCDRFMIGHMIGIEAVGLYGIGARLSAISQGIYVAFAGGWQFFAYSTMKDDDHTHLMSRVFEALGILSALSLLLLLPWIDWIFQLMVAVPYRQAFVVFPYLFISPLLLMLSQIPGTQLMVVKKPYLTVIFRIIGAIANIILNALLIPGLGILGAAVATSLAYFLMAFMVTGLATKMNLLFVKKRFLLVCFLMIIILALYSSLRNITVIISYPLIGVIGFMYRDEISFIFKKLKSRR